MGGRLKGVGREGKDTCRGGEYGRQFFNYFLPFLSVVRNGDLVQLILFKMQIYLRTAQTVGFFGSDPYLDRRLLVKLGRPETSGKGIVNVEIQTGNDFF